MARPPQVVMLLCLSNHCCRRQGFYYANGVALSADESFLVLVETDRIRAHKVWLKGPKVSNQRRICTAYDSKPLLALAAGGRPPTLVIRGLTLFLVKLTLFLSRSTTKPRRSQFF